MKIVAVILGLVVIFGGTIFLQNQKPKIELGLKDGRLKEIPSKPNCVSTQTEYDEKRVEAAELKDTVVESKEAMKKALNEYGDIEIVTEKDDYIYAVATTGMMKYHDDIEIYFDSANKKVQYRSASRAGYSDMGLNKERYYEIIKAYEAI